MKRNLLLLVGLIVLAGTVLGMQQLYPNMEGTRVLENENVIVERFTTRPGQWAGVHAHKGNQITVILNGGTVTFRENGHERVETMEDGSVIWVEATEGHDHGNTGDTPIEMLVFTLK